MESKPNKKSSIGHAHVESVGQDNELMLFVCLDGTTTYGRPMNQFIAAPELLSSAKYLRDMVRALGVVPEPPSNLYDRWNECIVAIARAEGRI